MKRLTFLFACCMMALVIFAADEELYYKSYSLENPDSAAIARAVQTLIGTEGTTVVFKAQQKLLVNTTSNKHEAVGLLLREINVPPLNVSVRVTFRKNTVTSESGVGLKRNRTIVVTEKGVDPESLKVSPRLNLRTTKEDSLTHQLLLVQSGSSGSIQVGQDIPFITAITMYALQWGYIEEPEIEWRSVGAFLTVEPQVVGSGPLIHLKITPELSGLVKDSDGHLDRRMRRIRFERVSTEVTVRSGQCVSLGGLVKDRDFYDKFLVGVNRQGVRQSLQITLTPTIQGGGRRQGEHATAQKRDSATTKEQNNEIKDQE